MEYISLVSRSDFDLWFFTFCLLPLAFSHLHWIFFPVTFKIWDVPIILCSPSSAKFQKNNKGNFSSFWLNFARKVLQKLLWIIFGPFLDKLWIAETIFNKFWLLVFFKKVLNTLFVCLFNVINLKGVCSVCSDAFSSFSESK